MRKWLKQKVATIQDDLICSICGLEIETDIWYYVLHNGNIVCRKCFMEKI